MPNKWPTQARQRINVRLPRPHPHPSFSSPCSTGPFCYINYCLSVAWVLCLFHGEEVDMTYRLSSHSDSSTAKLRLSPRSNPRCLPPQVFSPFPPQNLPSSLLSRDRWAEGRVGGSTSNAHSNQDGPGISHLWVINRVRPTVIPPNPMQSNSRPGK